MMMSTESLPRASVEDQIETPILIFSPSELPPSELELPPSPEQPARPARPATPPVRPAYLRKFLLERLPIVLPSLHLASLACTRCASSLKTMCKQRNRLFTTSKVMSRAARALLFVRSGCQRGFCRLVIPIRPAKMPLGENRLVPAKTFVQGGSCRRSGLCLFWTLSDLFLIPYRTLATIHCGKRYRMSSERSVYMFVYIQMPVKWVSLFSSV